jgi:hypothetical protein
METEAGLVYEATLGQQYDSHLKMHVRWIETGIEIHIERHRFVFPQGQTAGVDVALSGGATVVMLTRLRERSTN